ncbi:anti-sigma factor [Nocardiopsis potens]|uniref:anti-sigma factor n=1 Tax=Nocardiopsis potens TaxID=1246458 RepID=UPI00034BE5AC|nr:anti-sigma factor [Nocardiopsis potens]
MKRRGAEPHGLIAGYAVNALDEAERKAVEAHLPACEECRRDLREFRETAALLGSAEAAPVPEGLWERVREQAGRTRQLPPEAAPDRGRVRPPRRRLRTALPWAVAAAAVLAAAVLGGVAVEQNGRMESMRAHTAEVEALLAAEDTEMMTRPVSHSEASATLFVSQRSDTVMIMVEGLPPAPDGMGYQLWYVDPDGMRSAGMLHSDGGMLTGMSPGLGDAVEIGISMEPSGGAEQPTEEPMKVEV